MPLKHLVLVALFALAPLGLSRAEDEKPAAEAGAALDKAALEKAFAEKLSNCVLVGRFTDDASDPNRVPQLDRYEITKVTKLKDDLWMFSGIKYGSIEIKLPLVLRVVWADKTPMLTMDKFAIPGLGTFSFRIIFDGDRYAGTWQHDEHGGHMWGKIERAPAKADKPEDAKAKPADEKTDK